ncbi:PAS domain-containing protein [Dunaliella salina]|uniref:PAS domain-containing protein n=1 Tax=Dunaliella salina TaxID=3046 RepID=A0ABQ7GIZ0_DUNSA|nr:PAS domain-containing protein [Dunaliella salina]|eukprot:KAF5834561.1 PAS domain-containing protein [Dunaliella salina]
MELATSFLENPSGFASFLANPNDGKLTYVSDTYCDQTGFSRNELLGSEVLRVLTGDKTCRRTVGEIRDAVREERPCSVTLLTYNKDKEPYWAQLYLSPLEDGDGRIVHFMGLQANVTHLVGSTDPTAELDDERLECVAEEIELDSRKLASCLKLEPHWEHHGLPPAAATVPCSLKHALSSILSAFVLSNPHLPDCPIVFVSEPFLKLTGYSREQVVGRNCRFLQGPGTSPAEVQKIRDAMASEKPVTVTLLNYTAGGKPFWNLLHVAPIRDAGGQVAYYIGVQLGMNVTATSSESQEPPNVATSLPDSSTHGAHEHGAGKSSCHTDAAVQHELPPAPEPKFSDKLYYSDVTGAVRVAVRSLGGTGHGLRRSFDHGPHSSMIRKSMSSGLNGGSRSSTASPKPLNPVALPRSSVDFAYTGMLGKMKSSESSGHDLH